MFLFIYLMPRIRTIKPKFWDDIKLSKISRDARLLFIGIWNFSDDLGVIVAEPVWIKSKVFPYDKLEPEQFENWLKELIERKFIIPITNNDELFFYIRTFDRHQQINKPNHSDICIERELLMNIMEQSRNSHGLITETDSIITVSLQGGKEWKGKDSKGIVKERIEENFVFWESEKKSFLNSGDWIFKFCTDKNISLEYFDKTAKNFLNDIELKEDFKDLKEIKRHFTNWYNLKEKNGHKSVNGSNTEKLGTSAARIKTAKDW